MQGPIAPCPHPCLLPSSAPIPLPMPPAYWPQVPALGGVYGPVLSQLGHSLTSPPSVRPALTCREQCSTEAGIGIGPWVCREAGRQRDSSHAQYAMSYLPPPPAFPHSSRFVLALGPPHPASTPSGHSARPRHGSLTQAHVCPPRPLMPSLCPAQAHTCSSGLFSGNEAKQLQDWAPAWLWA